MDLVKAGYLFLRHCVFELGGRLCTWQKRHLDDQKSVASCVGDRRLETVFFVAKNTLARGALKSTQYVLLALQ